MTNSVDPDQLAPEVLQSNLGLHYLPRPAFPKPSTITVIVIVSCDVLKGYLGMEGYSMKYFLGYRIQLKKKIVEMKE